MLLIGTLCCIAQYKFIRLPLNLIKIIAHQDALIWSDEQNRVISDEAIQNITERDLCHYSRVPIRF